MNWNAIEAAGRSVNPEHDADYAALKESVRRATESATAVTQPVVRGAKEGRFTGLGIQKFQQELYAKNATWHFTDRTLCVLWKMEFPDTKADFISDCRTYINGTRSAVNRGKHGGSNPIPSEPYVQYNEAGVPIGSRDPRSRSAPTLPSSDAASLRKAQWDVFIFWAARFHQDQSFHEEERDYKLVLAKRLSEARDAARANTGDWLKLLRRAFTTPNNLTSFYAHAHWLDWWRDHEPVARESLLALWTATPEAPVGPLIRSFLETIPKTLRGGRGIRTNMSSYLLMGADPVAFPIYASTVYAKAFEMTGFGAPPGDADEGEVYEHALQFLDTLVAEGKARGLLLSDRLDAQGVLFCVAKYDPPLDWSNDDRKRFAEYRGLQMDEPSEPTSDPMEALADELLLDVEYLRRVERLLRDKRQMVFYGPPGTGKTYVAKRLAEVLATHAGGNVQIVQFHPAYAYEDFVEGFRPAETSSGQPGFALKDGPLKRIAIAAAQRPDVPHILIIDELNRGNIAKVFGELYFLLEYRDEAISLQYSDTPFTLPRNLWIIATMNTADRSIALVDAALRRRFYFQGFFPDQPPVEGLLRRWLAREHPSLGWVSGVVDGANEILADRNAAIGPSHFLRKDLSERWVYTIWEHAILPTVEEHFFGEPEKLKLFALERLRGLTVAALEDDTDDDGPADTD